MDSAVSPDIVFPHTKYQILFLQISDFVFPDIRFFIKIKDFVFEYYGYGSK